MRQLLKERKIMNKEEIENKIKEIFFDTGLHIGDGIGDICSGYDEEAMEEAKQKLSTLIQDEKEDSFINGFEVGYENGVYEYKRDLTDQPLTSSIWGKRMNQISNEYLDKVPVKIHDPEFKYLKSFGIRIKDKWYKELWWSIIEFIRRNK